MKNLTLLCALGIFALAASVAQAADTFLSESFTYSNGNLTGNGNWTNTGTGNITNAIQVTNNAAVMGTAGGTDVYKALSGNISMTLTNQVVTSTLDINVTSAKSGGDYFFHLSNPAGTTTNFYNRLFIKTGATAGTFLLGIAGNSTATYGTTELTFGSTYTVQTKWNVVAGGNDTFDILVAGSSYLTGVTYADAGSVTTIAAVNLRQGGSTTSPGLTVDNISVTAIPEPGLYGLAFASLLGSVVVFRVRRGRREPQAT